jgi:hypothetical protein
VLAIVLVFLVAFSGSRPGLDAGGGAGGHSAVSPRVRATSRCRGQRAHARRRHPSTACSTPSCRSSSSSGATISFLFVTGEGSSVRDIVGSADSYASLVYGSVLAVVVAGA